MTVIPDWLRADDARASVRLALRDWLEIQRRCVFDPQRARRVLEHTVEPRRVLQELYGRPGRPPAHREIETLARVRAVAVPFGSQAYPGRVARLADAPSLLLVDGDASLLCAPAVAIVGARAATAYGRATAHRFATALARAGLVVVSGLAAGVDAAAHAAVIDAGGRTVAVLACGLDLVYPSRHRALSRRVAASGALVTEFPVGTPPRPAHFPLRNRIISALTHAVLVVEARVRSGSLVTARHAADQGVDVWAVPGPVDSPASAGTNQLLRDGAYVAHDPDEMLEALSRDGLPLARPGRAPAAHRAPAVSDVARRILAALEDSPCTRDALSRALKLAPEGLAPALLELELVGAVAEDRDGCWRIVSPPPA